MEHVLHVAQMKTSLIVNVYNRAAWLKVCLGALLHQRVRPDEVIVADDGSSPAEVAAVKAFLESYPIPHQYTAQRDKGFRAAAARNMGIRLATGEYLCFIDCDIVLMPCRCILFWGTFRATLWNPIQFSSTVHVSACS